ncbi:MAG: hypothetical protein P8Y95_11410 [Gammaproteobacteria bacterium]|jgi:hypothetical protein
MSVKYRIDPDQGMVFSTVQGPVTAVDLLEHERALREDPRFRPHYSELYDFREMAYLSVSAEAARLFAKLNPFTARSRRAVVASGQLHCGLINMFVHMADWQHHGRVFGDADQAREWLGLDWKPITQREAA